MQKYLLSIYQPDGPPPPPEFLEPVMREVGILVREMKAADVLVFNAGLHPPSTATVLQRQGDEVLTTDGPYLEGKEHIGGFDVIQAPDLDAALEWGRKVAKVLAPLAIEVRPLADEADSCDRPA